MPETAAPVRPQSPSESRFGDRLWNWLPAEVDGRIRVFAWLSFLAEVIIIGTGGAVRLTGSGLGCSEWPLCTPESLVPTPEQGFHGIIEFGNRTMTGVVGLLAVAVIVLLWRVRAQRRDLFVLSVVILLGGIIPQAIVGGITVITKLNPFIVGFHYTASLLLVCVTAAFLLRMNQPAGPRVKAVPSWFAILTHVTGLALAVTIVVGVLTTGSGPHSGDADIQRHGFDATVMAHVHSWPGYILAALVLTLAVIAWAMRLEPRRWLLVLILAIAVQVGVGILQSRTGLPEVLVGIHMVLAALSAAAYTIVVLKLKRPAAEA
ncbi:cytochrome c oxidase assembly protein subunit 15 [Microbacterium resistens]|uniref:Cytochrome c oxidase assembly protein subunit 15 n=1 Tax=Microbacterium resistens TaxID=156977 RepID=A0ABU1SFA3_9MICO|nr:COX15/CtaA family protein [Microbacterium resistens]MDR6868276.1 cytochrome c oxidase assembly protein subunit 15 [Microbacterium resistens]